MIFALVLSKGWLAPQVNERVFEHVLGARIRDWHGFGEGLPQIIAIWGQVLERPANGMPLTQQSTEERKEITLQWHNF